MNDDTRSRKALLDEIDALRRENLELKQQLETTDSNENQDSGNTLKDKKTILIVDDNEDTRLIVGDMVVDLGYAPIEAATPSDAIDRVAKAPDAIDLIISDIVMPDEDGPDMIDQILELKPDIKVIFMSGYAEDEIVHDAVYKIQDSKAAFIKKPFSKEELSSLLQETINK